MDKQQRGIIVLDITGDEPDQISLCETDSEGNPEEKKVVDKTKFIPLPELQIVPTSPPRKQNDKQKQIPGLR